MNINITVEQRLLEKIHKLPSNKIKKLENFIDFLAFSDTESDHKIVMAASQMSNVSFAKIWDNPEDAEYDNL
jgi:hypothetical protein